MSVKDTITPEQLATYTELVKEKKKLRKKGSKAMLIFYLVCFVFGALVGGFGIGFLERGGMKLSIRPPFAVKEGLEIIYLVAALVFFYITTVMQTIIHEAGHLVFGLLTGYKFLSFRIFSFILVKKDGKIVRKKLKVVGIPGQCLMAPPEWKEDGKFPYVWYNLGGGLLNIIASLLVVPLFFLHIPCVSWMVGIFIFTGVLLGLTNVIPMTMGIPNDGKNCLLCRKAKDNQRAFYLQLKMNAMMSDGVAVTDMPEAFFETKDDEPVNALTCYVRLMKFYRYLLLGEEAAAKACLAVMEEQSAKLPVAFVNSIDVERIFCLLKEDAPLEELAAYYAVVQPVFLQNRDISILRVKYAYYTLLTEEERELIEWLIYSKKNKLPKKLPKRKPVSAEQLYEDMEKALEKHPVIGEAELYMELVKCL